MFVAKILLANRQAVDGNLFIKQLDIHLKFCENLYKNVALFQKSSDLSISTLEAKQSSAVLVFANYFNPLSVAFWFLCECVLVA